MAAVNRMTMTSRHRHGDEEENCARGAACRTWRAARWDGTGCPGTDSSRPLISPNIYLEHLHLQSATNGSTQCARMELTAVTRPQEVVMLVLALILNVVDVVLFLDARACHGAWVSLYLAVAQVILLYWLVEELTKRGLFSAAIRGALAWMALVLIVAGWFLVAKSQETPRPYVGILVTIAAWAPIGVLIARDGKRKRSVGR